MRKQISFSHFQILSGHLRLHWAFLCGNQPHKGVNNDVYNDIDGTLKQQMENGYKLCWIGIGKADFLYGTNKRFRKKQDNVGMEATRRPMAVTYGKIGEYIFLSLYRCCFNK